MSEVFGRAWEASCGHVGGAVYETWKRELIKLESRQLARGLGKVIEAGDEFPPNLVKFLKLCRETTPAYHRQLQIEHDKPETPQTRKVAADALANLRASVGMSPKPLPEQRAARETRLLERKDAP